jgi:hypothetical protein
MKNMKYAPLNDASGRLIKPGDRVRIKTYPKGVEDGTIEISKRELEVMPDGSKVPALVVRSDDGTFYGSLTSKSIRLIRSGSVLIPKQIKYRNTKYVRADLLKHAVYINTIRELLDLVGDMHKRAWDKRIEKEGSGDNGHSHLIATITEKQGSWVISLLKKFHGKAGFMLRESDSSDGLILELKRGGLVQMAITVVPIEGGKYELTKTRINSWDPTPEEESAMKGEREAEREEKQIVVRTVDEIFNLAYDIWKKAHTKDRIGNNSRATITKKQGFFLWALMGEVHKHVSHAFVDLKQDMEGGKKRFILTEYMPEEDTKTERRILTVKVSFSSDMATLDITEVEAPAKRVEPIVPPSAFKEIPGNWMVAKLKTSHPKLKHISPGHLIYFKPSSRFGGRGGSWFMVFDYDSQERQGVYIVINAASAMTFLQALRNKEGKPVIAVDSDDIEKAYKKLPFGTNE